MKTEIILRIFGIMIAIIGVIIIWLEISGLLALGVSLLIWSNNIGKRLY